MTIEERFLSRLAQGKPTTQDDYHQMAEFIDPLALALALVQRFAVTGEMPTLLEAANLYAHAEEYYNALEICSRFPNIAALRHLTQQILPHLREEYPATRMVGKLLDEAFLVIELDSGNITRYPPIMPSTSVYATEEA